MLYIFEMLEQYLKYFFITIFKEDLNNIYFKVFEFLLVPSTF